MLLASSIPSVSCPMSPLRSVLPLLGVSKDSMALNAASIVACLLEVLLALPLTLPLTLLDFDRSLIERMVLETRCPCLVGRWSSNACGP